MIFFSTHDILSKESIDRNGIIPCIPAHETAVRNRMLCKSYLLRKNLIVRRSNLRKRLFPLPCVLMKESFDKNGVIPYI